MRLDSLKLKGQLRTSLAIEGAEVTVEEIDLPEAEADTVSAQAIETIGDQADIDKMDKEADDLAKTEELSGELIAAVESTIYTNRGLTPIEAAALKLTTKQLVGKYSASAAEIIPAREQFGGTADTMETTVLACEGLKETFNTFWEAAKAQFMKIIEAIQKIFRKIMSLFTSVTKRAQALKARAETAEITLNGTVKINSNPLKVGSEPLNVAATAGMRNILDLVTALLKSSRQIDDRAEINKGVEAITDKSAWESYVDGVNSYARRTFDAVDSKKEGVTTLLPGNRAITFTEGEPGTRDQFSFEALVRFGDEQEEIRDVPSLTKKEIIDVADLVIATADQISQYDKVWSKGVQKASRLVQGINAAVKTKFAESSKDASKDQADVVEQDTETAGFKLNVSALIAHVRHIDKFSSDLIAFAQATSNDVLSYGEKSLSEVTASPENTLATTE